MSVANPTGPSKITRGARGAGPFAVVIFVEADPAAASSLQQAQREE